MMSRDSERRPGANELSEMVYGPVQKDELPAALMSGRLTVLQSALHSGNPEEIQTAEAEIANLVAAHPELRNFGDPE